MVSSMLTSLLAFSAFSSLPLTLVSANPLKMRSTLINTEEVFGLVERQSCGNIVTYSVHYDNCNVCTPSGNGAGPPVCTQKCYFHNGDSGFSCDDNQCFFDTENFCEVSENGQIITPFGMGNWNEAPGCSEDNDQGTYAGTIVSPNGGNDWSCSCLNPAKGITGNNFCGQEYACTEVWTCGCSKCEN